MNRHTWRLDKAGDFERLELAEENMPNGLSSGQVRVKNYAAGLNFADLFAITGLYSATPQGRFTPGLEFSGDVIAIADDVTEFKVGDSVMGVTRFGAFSNVIDVNVRQCSILPAGWNYAQGAALLVQALTAWYALFELGNLKPGQTVLVHSAAGGVGLNAMKMIRAAKAVGIGCVGNSEKMSWLKRQGYDQVFVRDAKFKQALAAELKGKPLHLVLDAIGGSIQKDSFDLMAPMGRLVSFGAAQYTPGKKRPNWIKAAYYYLTRPKYDALAMVSENKSIMGFNLIWLWEQIDLFEQMLSSIQALSLTPPYIDREYSFQELPYALEYLRSGLSKGKVILKANESTG